MPTDGDLPVRLTAFIGRRTEIDDVRAITAKDRFVTLTGPAGIGKTRLAIEVASLMANDFADGCRFVDLAPTTDSNVVAETITHAMGIPDQAGRSAMEALLGYVADRRMLVVLDTCEHVLDAVGSVAEAMLNAGPRVTVLATSRAPTGVAGERTWIVPPLAPTDDGLDLFIERASRVLPEFWPIADDLAIVVDICRRLDGLPLAIELAAARVRALSLRDIAECLDDRFRLLVGGGRTAAPRHQTMRASVDWSYDLLTEPERDLFRRIGVFVGGFDLAAARDVGIDRDSVLDLVGHLVEKSLVVAEKLGASMRYRLLETMRRYALEELGESGAADAARDAHCDHFVERAADRARGHRADFLRWAGIEFGNLRAAHLRSVDRGDVDTALRLASSLQPFWLHRGYLREGLAWFDSVLPDEPDPGSSPDSWIRAVAHASTLGAWLQSATSLDRALTAASMARRLGDPALLAAVLNACSLLTRYDPETSQTYLSEAADLGSAGADPATTCETALHQTIWSGGMAGDPRGARVAAEECLRLAAALDDGFMSWSGRAWLANALTVQGNLGHAASVLEPMVEQKVATGLLVSSFHASVFLGRVRAHQGRPDAARACWEAAEATASSMGGFQPDAAYAMLAEAYLAAGDALAAAGASEASWQHTAPGSAEFNRVINPVAETLLASGAIVEARRWADDTMAIALGSNRIPVLHARARIACAQGEFKQAGRDANEALDVARDTGAFLRLSDVIECVAQLSTYDGDHLTACRLFGAAEAIRRAKDVVRFPMYQNEFDDAVSTCRTAAGDEYFGAAWSEGAALTIEEAIAYAQRRRGKRTRPRSGWDSLTPTEASVVRLVGDGLDNKAIAASLLISHRTVQTHLTHVYTKLGINSRIGLIREAGRHA